MSNKKMTSDKSFRSLLEVKREYLPVLLESQSTENVQKLAERTAEVTEQALRKHVGEVVVVEHKE